MSAVTGEPEVWSDKWLAIGSGPHAKLFTRGRWKTGHQFNHKLYFHDLCVATMALPGDPSFIEFGAGRGTTAQYLTSIGHEVTLLDLSEEGFDLARKNFAEEGMRPPKCVIADVQQTGLPDAEFDCVYSIGLLEHFDDPRGVLRESLRVIRKRGVFFHTILDGDVIKSGGVHRTNYQAERYEAWAIECGAGEASCQPYRIPGVLLLSGVK